jgi:hypothetical protein
MRASLVSAVKVAIGRRGSGGRQQHTEHRYDERGSSGSPGGLGKILDSLGRSGARARRPTHHTPLSELGGLGTAR